MKQRRSVTLVVACVLASACGSTVQVGVDGHLGTDAAGGAPADAIAEGDQGFGLGMPTADPGGTAPTTEGTDSSTDDTFAVGSSSSGGGETGSTGPSSGTGTQGTDEARGTSGSGSDGGGTGSASTAPGVSADAINMGILYVPDLDEAEAALGDQGDQQGKVKEYWDALLAEFNEAGGVLGRELVPVYFKGSATSTRSLDEQQQAACSYWHEDHEVLAVTTDGGFYPILTACTHEAGAFRLEANTGSVGREFLQRFPYHVEATSFDKDQEAAAVVRSLTRQGYFEGAAVHVGLVTWDLPAYRTAMDRTMVPAVRSLGLRDPEVAYIQPPQSPNDFGSTSAEIQSAQLRFRSEGVTHVAFLAGDSGYAAGGFIPIVFMGSAESQGYRPRYGLNSNTGMGSVSSNVPERQLEDAIAVSWLPFWDVYGDQLPDPPGRRACEEAARSRGIVITSGNQPIILEICDRLLFLKRALEAGETADRDGFLRGVEGLGASFSPITTWTTRFGPDRHTGAEAVRPVAYVQDCGCWRYTGPARSAGG